MKTIRHDEQPCLDCGAMLDSLAPMGDGDGDCEAVTVCAYCGHVMAVTGDNRLRALNDAEAREVAADPRIRMMQEAVVRAREDGNEDDRDHRHLQRRH